MKSTFDGNDDCSNSQRFRNEFSPPSHSCSFFYHGNAMTLCAMESPMQVVDGYYQMPISRRFQFARTGAEFESDVGW